MAACTPGCSPILPPWLQPAFYYSPPKVKLQQGTVLGVWGNAQGAFGTAYGAAQQLIPLADLELFF